MIEETNPVSIDYSLDAPEIENLDTFDQIVANTHVAMDAEEFHPVEAQEQEVAPEAPADPEAHLPHDLRGTDVEPLNLLNARALANIPPLQWLVDQRIPASLLTVLWGQGGSFKSFMALDWALSVASGTPWQGTPTTQAPVIYVSGEGASGLYPRVEAWEAAHPGANTRFFAVVPHAVKLLDDYDVKRLRKTIAGLSVKPGLIVFDTLQRTMAGLGDENNTQDLSKLIATIDSIREEFGCAVLVVHHSGADGQRARGNAVLRNSADAMWQLKRMGEPGSQDPRVTLLCDKVKDIEEPPALALTTSRSRDSIVLVPSNHTTTPAAIAGHVSGSWNSRPF